MASSGAAALIVGPLGANPAFLALPPFAGAAWYTQMAGVTLALTAMQVFAKSQMNTASLKDEFEKLYEMNVRNIPETQWPDGTEEGEIQKLLSVYKKKSKKFIDRRRSSISAQSMKATRLHTRTKHLKLKFSRLNIHQSLP